MSIPTTTTPSRTSNMRIRRWRLPLAVTIAAAALVSACGGDSEPAPAEASGGGLAEAFGLPGFSGDGQNVADQENQIEEAIAECMAGKGFEYLADKTDAVDVPDFTNAEERVEYARTNGYDISLPYDNPDYKDQGFIGASEDADAEILEAMSESERTAYYEALDGTPDELAAIETEVDPDTGEEIALGQAGCRGDAYEAGYGDTAAYDAMAPLEEEIAERVRADPRYQELLATWQACMSERGLNYEDDMAVYAYTDGEFKERVTAVLGFDPYGGLYEQLSEEDFAFMQTATPAEADARMREVEQAALADVDRAALRGLQEEERTLAVAEAECTGAILTDSIALYTEIETRFVEDNADRIAEAAAQVNG